MAGFLRNGLICAALAGGCISVDPYVAPPPLPPDATPPALEPLAGPISLELAVRRALQNSSELAALRGEAEVARREIESAGDIRDPEVRLGYGEMDANTTGTGWGTQTSTGFERGTRTGSQEETQRGASTDSKNGQETDTFTDGSPPHDAASSSQSSSTSDRSSSSTFSEDFSRRSQTQSSTLQGDDGDAWRESWEIGLRAFPPNPWTYKAQKSLAAAESYVAQAELRQAQVDLAAEVAVLFSEIQLLQEDVNLLEQLAALHKFAYQAYHELHVRSEGTTTMGDDMLIWRRYQGAVSDLNKARRSLDVARRELAGHVAVPFPALSVNTNRSGLDDWNPSTSNEQLLCEQALNERADVAACGWKVVVAQAGHREATSYRIPWFSHVEASYGFASEGSSSYRWSEEDESQTQKGESSGISSGTTSGTGSGTQTGTSVESVNDTQLEKATSRSTETSTETGSSTQSSKSQQSSSARQITSSQETVIDEADRHEWYVGVGLNIPIFSWTKSGVEARAAEKQQALEVLGKVRQAAVRQVGDGLDVFRKTEEARLEYAKQAAADRNYLEQGLAKIESQGVLSASQLLPLKADLLELQRLALNLDHEHRLAAIQLQAALGHIVGVDQPILSAGPSEIAPPAAPIATVVSGSSIHEAVMSNDIRRVAALLMASPPGAVNSTINHGVTPLHLAAAMNHRKSAELLICFGANVKAVTASGYTPLHWAASRNSADTAELLIAMGAAVNARAHNGVTPLRWASEKGAQNVMQLLMTVGADALEEMPASASPPRKVEEHAAHPATAP